MSIYQYESIMCNIEIRYLSFGTTRRGSRCCASLGSDRTHKEFIVHAIAFQHRAKCATFKDRPHLRLSPQQFCCVVKREMQ
jgi:hypothetical protein